MSDVLLVDCVSHCICGFSSLIFVQMMSSFGVK